MSDPLLLHLLVVGFPVDVTRWEERQPRDLVTALKVRVDRANVRTLGFAGSLPWAGEALRNLARAGSRVHAVAHWQDRLGAASWVHVRDGVVRPLDVPPGPTLALITDGPRVYTTQPDGKSQVGPGALQAMFVAQEHSPSAPAAPHAIVLDRAALVTPRSAEPDPDLHWDGGAVTLSTPAWGRHLLTTTAGPEQRPWAPWAPWAWDALEGYAAAQWEVSPQLAHTLTHALGANDPGVARALVSLPLAPLELVKAARASGSSANVPKLICGVRADVPQTQHAHRPPAPDARAVSRSRGLLPRSDARFEPGLVLAHR